MHNDPDLYLGIDLGTSGCRAVAIDAAGDVIAESAVPLPPPLAVGSRREQDPELWWVGVREVIGQVASQAGGRGIQSIAVDGTSATLLLTDDAATPLGNALMYNDARAQREAERIERRAGDLHAAAGPSSSLAKLLWLISRPENAKAAHALHQADWICARLCGKAGVSDENNCLKMGFDPVQRRWPQWISNLGVPPGLLPKVVSPGTIVETVTPQLAKELGIPEKTRIVAGTTDSTAACLAAGARNPGEAVTILGSTLVLKVVSSQPVFDARHGIYSHRVGDIWIAGGASNTGGAVLLKHFSQEQLDALTPKLLPGQPTGLDYYPLPDRGERFPLADPQLEPRLAPHPGDDRKFLQGLLEGMARIEAHGYRLLHELGAPFPVSIHTSGGGAKNEAWRMMREREIGVPVSVAPRQDAAYGAALLARKGVTGQ